MNIKIEEYGRLKRRIESELSATKDEIMDLFDGVMFDYEIYENLDKEDRIRHSQLRQIMDNLKGQLDAFKRLEGYEDTELNKLLRWKESTK